MPALVPFVAVFPCFRVFVSGCDSRKSLCGSVARRSRLLSCYVFLDAVTTTSFFVFCAMYGPVFFCHSTSMALLQCHDFLAMIAATCALPTVLLPRPSLHSIAILDFRHLRPCATCQLRVCHDLSSVLPTSVVVPWFFAACYHIAGHGCSHQITTLTSLYSDGTGRYVVTLTLSCLALCWTEMSARGSTVVHARLRSADVNKHLHVRPVEENRGWHNNNKQGRRRHKRRCQFFLFQHLVSSASFVFIVL